VGVNRDAAEFIISTKCNARSVCTLGRLNLFVSFSEIRALARRYCVPLSEFTPPSRSQYFADDLFRMLGFERIESLDVSDYEGATIVHDLNTPLPKDLHEQFDLVLDGGTLEHVFNFPVALKSAMEMVKVGGSLIIIDGMNNLCGHGFYQFSPELFYRALSIENGFEVKRMYVPANGTAYKVVDPIQVHGRVQLVNCKPVEVMVDAQRTHSADIFAVAPQQSDYVTTWSAAIQGVQADGRLKARLRRYLRKDQVARISNFLNHLRQRRAVRRFYRTSRLSNRRLYRPVKGWG